MTADKTSLREIINKKCCHPRYSHGCQECNHLVSQIESLFNSKLDELREKVKCLGKVKILDFEIGIEHIPLWKVLKLIKEMKS